MPGPFEKKCKAWSENASNRLNAVFRTAVQDMIEEAQKPTAKGGRMRVDTGFLRNSGIMSVNSVPKGESSAENMANIPLALTRVKFGDTIYFGWVANYARYREAQDGFARMAAQQWTVFVKKAAKRIKKTGSGLK